MAGYILNGNPWGGSFILEASTDGNGWDAMVAKSGTAFLSREGLTTGGDRNSGYNSETFSNTTFTIYKPSGTYYPPDRVTHATFGTLKQYSTTECKVTLSRDPASTGTWEKGLNTKEDFSVNCVLSSTATYPYFTAGTACNCVVTNYNSGMKQYFNLYYL